MQPPAWSFSAHRTFRECKREYFYDKYYMLCRDKYHVLALKKMTSLPLLAGSIVHGVIAEGLWNRFRYGRAPAEEQMTAVFRERFDTAVRRSAEAADKSLYSARADDMLEEHYYGDPDTDEKIGETGEKAAAGLSAFCRHKVWLSLMNDIEERNVRYLEKEKDFPSFDLEGIKVYAVIDLALCGKNWFRIFDWKTGKPGSADKTQLAVYGLFAAREWGWDPEKVKFTFVYLSPETVKQEESITSGDIKETQKLIKESYAEMLALYNGGSPAAEDFPQSPGARCGRCRYRELCGKQF